MGAGRAAGGAAPRGAPCDLSGRGGDPASLVQGPGLRHREPLAGRGRLHRGPPQRQAHAGASRALATCSANAFLPPSSARCHCLICNFVRSGYRFKVF